MNKERLIEAFAQGLNKPALPGRAPCAHGAVYRVEDADHANNNIRGHWMHGRLRAGDHLMIVNSLRADTHTYALIQKTNEGYRLCEGSFHVASGTPGVKIVHFTKEQGLRLLEKTLLPFETAPLSPAVCAAPRAARA